MAVPPYVLDRIAESGEAAASANAVATRRADATIRGRRMRVKAATPPSPPPSRLGLVLRALACPRPGGVRSDRVIFDAGGDEVEGNDTVVARSPDVPPVGDHAARRVWSGLGTAFRFFHDSYRRRSFDGRGATLPGVVRFGSAFNNAFWDGSEFVFGDPDGVFFADFTGPTIVVHEYTHAVTGAMTALPYRGQAGAIVEHYADVFAIAATQGGRPVGEVSWLVGPGVFTDRVHARGLRDVANPGTAYDDPVLGRDPQPAHMRDYVDTSEDHGGVHYNSGIPNAAFAVYAGEVGLAFAADVWFDALSGLGPGAGFASLASATETVAVERRLARPGRAWLSVGVAGARGGE